MRSANELDRNESQGAATPRLTFGCALLALIFVLLAGCTPARYRKSADKEVYRIVQQKQTVALGQTNQFDINTPYSQRKPEDIQAGELIADRSREGKQVLTLPEALRIALQNSRDYQFRKEQLYLSALSLTRARFTYVPQFFARSTVSGVRGINGEESFGVGSEAGFAQAFKTGGSIGLDLANDLLNFYTGGRSESAISTIGLRLSQPLLRGAGAKIAAENLTQAERNVIYEIRDFSYYQHTFAFDIVTTYLRLVQQQDTVKNQHSNYLSRVSLRERSVALAFDRLAPFQADQAAQEELTARNTYILAVERYRNTLDQFKITLGLPAAYDVRLDDSVLAEMEAVGLPPVPLTDEQTFRLAMERRPDLLNEIDSFEDSKRKIVVAANRLKADVVLFANYTLASEGETDYTKFDLDSYRLEGGVRLDLPLNRKLERNDYRLSIIDFERQLRGLALFLDNLKSDLRADLRNLDLSRQTYDIQLRAKALADRRVESSELSLQAGRIQVRDVVDAQTSRVQAYNAATAALVEYHLTRMRLLLDLGILNANKEKFWLDYGDLPQPSEAFPVPAPGTTTTNQLITPEQLFSK